MQRLLYSSATLITLLTASFGIQNALTAKAANTSDPSTRIELSRPTEINSVLHIANRLGWRFQARSSRFRRGGFARGEGCPPNAEVIGITPFVDSEGNPLIKYNENNEREEIIAPVATTTQQRPTLFIHVPFSGGTRGLLTVQDYAPPRTSNSNARFPDYYYQLEFDVVGEMGIIGIRLPDNAPPLELGSRYEWKVSITCGSDSINDSLTTRGGILEMTSLDLEPSIANLDAYIEAGIWQESLTILAEDRYINGTGLQTTDGETYWELAMEAAGLSEFADEPIVQIVDPSVTPETDNALGD